jgi:hypothetical protein
MNPRAWLILASIAGALAFGWFTLVLLTPTFGKIVGYANQQPPLQIVQPARGWLPDDVAKIHRLAKLHFEARPGLAADYWPEPAFIEERATCFIVRFDRKLPIYRWLGYEQIQRPTDTAMFLTIEKKDYTTRFGIICP